MLVAGRENPKPQRSLRVMLANILLNAGADVNARDNEGRTVLHVAATLGDNELVARLVQHPQLQVNLPDKKKDSALTLAVWHGHTSVCELLLQAKADPNHRQATGHTALLLLICLAYPEALRSHRLTLFRLLVSYGADISLRVDGDLHRTVLAEVCANGDVELCREILRCTAAASTPSPSVSQGSAHAIQFSAAARYDLINRADDKRDSPLTLAVWNGHVPIVELLLETGVCDVTQRQHTGHSASELIELANYPHRAHVSRIRHLLQAYAQSQPRLRPSAAALAVDLKAAAASIAPPLTTTPSSAASVVGATSIAPFLHPNPNRTQNPTPPPPSLTPNPGTASLIAGSPHPASTPLASPAATAHHSPATPQTKSAPFAPSTPSSTPAATTPAATAHGPNH